MKIKNFKDSEGFENMHSIQKAVKLQDSEHAQIIHMELSSGDQVKEHITPVEVSFFVIEGEVEMNIGDETQSVREGSLVESPAHIKHSFRNTADSNARVLVIKHLKS